MRCAHWRLLLLCGLLSACSSSKGSDTAVTVVVWTDLSVPTEINNVHAEVKGSNGEIRTLTLDVKTASSGSPVAQFTLVPAGDNPEFDLHVAGRLGDTSVVEQEVVSFAIPGERRTIAVLLSRSCKNVPCTNGVTTCWYANCVGTSQAPQVYDPNNPVKPQGPGDAGVDGPDATVSIDALDRVDLNTPDMLASDARDAGSDLVVDVSVPETIDASENPGDTPGNGLDATSDSEGTGGTSGAGGGGGSGGAGGAGGSTTTVISCRPPDKPDNGEVVFTSTAPGATATYSCGSGYALSGAATIKCKSDGTWSDAAPSCLRDCGAPPAATSGTVETTGTTVGSKATYACPTGNSPVSTIVTCQSDGTWSGGAPTCSLVSCPDLDRNLSHGTVDLTTRTYQSKAVYRCDPGYNLTAPSERICQADETWSGALPACTPVDCGPLPDPTNGTVTPTPNTTYGSTASYSCKKGYAPFGGSARQCQADRTWSGTAPTCEVNCGQPAIPDHGSATIPAAGTWKGATIQYFCYGDLQRFPSSASSSTCQEDGTWSGSLPSCLCLGSSSLDWGTDCPISCSSGTTVTGVKGCDGSCWQTEQKCQTP
jgi:hypothetical protein